MENSKGSGKLLEYFHENLSVKISDLSRLQMELITNHNEQPKCTSGFKTKVQMEFKGKQTKRNHVDVKSQGRAG